MYNFIQMGNLIRKYREERELTIEQLAEICDLSYRCISNIERGLASPKFYTVIKIFFVLDENLNELKKFLTSKENIIYRKELILLNNKDSRDDM